MMHRGRQIRNPEAQKCDGEVFIPASQRGRNKPLGQKCKNLAVLELDDVPMCLRHAQQKALDDLLDAYEASRS